MEYIKNSINDDIVPALPNNIEAEQYILGALLINNNHLEKIIDFLKSDHFFVPIHQKIYELILRFSERGSVATAVALKSYIEEYWDPTNPNQSAYSYLITLTANAQILYDIEALARIVYELAVRRFIIDIAQQAIKRSKIDNLEIAINDRIEEIEQQLFNLAYAGENEGKILKLNACLKTTIKKITESRERGGVISGVSTQFIEIDKKTGGMQNSDLVIIAARPAMGKTSLAINIAINAAEFFIEETKKKNSPEKSIKSVAFFSLEMSSEQIGARILSIRTGIDGSKIRSGMINKEEFEKLVKESAGLAEMNFFIDDSPALSISAIRTRARRMKRQNNIGLIVVDYLQLIRPSGFSRETNRVQEIGEISQGLKALAKELNIPVIALSQLSRAVESREDKRPLLSDLRESGNIEQDADVVMFIYREEYYSKNKSETKSNTENLIEPKIEEKSDFWNRQITGGKVGSNIIATDGLKTSQKIQDTANIAEIIIAKQRNGPTGICRLRFDNATTNFSNLDFINY